MNVVVFILGLLVAAIQWLPLTMGARLGRCGGALAWWVDRRHRRVALANLALALPELTASERGSIARENFRRLGENYVCALKTATLSPAELATRVDWTNVAESLPNTGQSAICAVGHFGNFELYARSSDPATGWRVATTYRALPHPGMNRLLQSIRDRSRARFFERRTEARQLRDFVRQGRVILGLLADQHAGDRGLWLPFFGHPCSCNSAPAVMALRYDAPLFVAVCFRTSLARWRIEMTAQIPTREADGSRRCPKQMTAEINRHYETAIRRDPANWFWVHRRWKPISRWQAMSPAEQEATMTGGVGANAILAEP